MPSRILFLVNDARFFASHRLAIADAALNAGYQVTIACPPDDHATDLANSGYDVRLVALARGKLGPAGELRSLIELRSLFRAVRPDLLHLITSKPIIYGGIIARFERMPVVAAVSGLGHVFIEDSIKARALRKLAMLGYRLALGRRGAHAIFQNRENLALFRDAGALAEEPVLIRGSGTDLAKFDPGPNQGSGVAVVLPARMLETKGVLEFVAAARLLQARRIDAKFRLIGDPDPANPASIAEAQLQAWNSEGVVSWEPHRHDIEAVLARADIVALPSHNEGFPKTLVDAAAAGRPTVTTDVVGCRDAITAGETGLLANPHDPEDLADKLEELITNPARRLAMGQAGRRLAEAEFGIDRITAQHLALYRRALTGSAAR